MRKILWLTPPLLGVAFYAAGSMAGSRDVSSARGADRVGDRAATMMGERLVPEGASGEDMRQAVQDGVAGERTRIETLGAEELKEVMLQIMDRLKHDPDDPAEWLDLWTFMNDAALRLGKVGQGAAWPWLLEHVPDARKEFMSGWAEVDPAGAFEAVVHSELREPCAEETLQKLLQSCAAQGPAKLRDACLRVPWALFLDSPSSVSVPGVLIDSESDVRPWIDSGVVPELQRRGVRCGAILSEWAEQYPREVLAQWRAGSGLVDADVLMYMLTPKSSRRIERSEAISTALSELPEEDRERLLQQAGVRPDDPLYPTIKERFFDKDRDRKSFAQPSQ